jgi:thioredoxin reductase
MTTQEVSVIGDGPGGLSAALFLAKNGVSVSVYGQDKTAMHFALLKNYLGLPEILGADFQRIARAQVEALGAKLVSARVESVTRGPDGFAITLEGGERVTSKFLVLSEGKSPRLAQQLGLTFDAKNGLSVDGDGKTAIDGVYAIGRLARPTRSQAIISAGDGAKAAIDILSRLKGEPVQDWDEPAKKD